MKLPIILLIVGYCWASVTFGKGPCSRAKRAIGDSSEESDSREEECDFSLINDNRRGGLSQWISRRFFRQWWQGILFSPNVCQRVENEEEPVNDASPHAFYHFESCRDTGRSRRCFRQSTQNSTLVKSTTVYECCPGFSREYGDDGCPKNFELKNLQDTLTDMNLTTFLEAARQAKLFDSLTDDGNYTIFAPNNEAFEKTPSEGEISFVTLSSNDNTQFQREILASHVVARRLDYDSLENEKSLQSMKQDAIIRPVFYSGLTSFSQISTVNCVPLVKADIQAKNGIVHVIDHVMPEATKTLYQILKDDSRFSTFLSLANEEVLKSLDNPKMPVTVFAFTDDSFGRLPDELQERIKNKVSCTSDLILNHIVNSTMCSSALVLMNGLKTSNGRLLFFKYNQTSTIIDESTPILVNDRSLISKDKIATNGVLHIVEKPILYTDNMDALEVLSAFGYADLAQALKINPISEALSNSNFTELLIPPKAIIEQALNSNDSDAKEKFLKNVVVDTSSDGRSTVKMLSKNIYPLTGSFRPRIGCAAEIFRDVSSCNGMIRFLKHTLPNVSGQNMMDTLRSNSNLSKFTALVENAGMDVSVFANESNYLTLLAPLNSAFSEEQYDDLMQNQESSREFVRKHVIRGGICCDQLTETTFYRKSSSLRSYYSRMLGMRKALIKQCNNLTTNGIVHVIDKASDRRRGFFDSEFFDSIFDETSLFDLSW